MCQETSHYLWNAGPDFVRMVHYCPGKAYDRYSEREGKYVRCLPWSTLTSATPSFAYRTERKRSKAPWNRFQWRSAPQLGITCNCWVDLQLLLSLSTQSSRKPLILIADISLFLVSSSFLIFEITQKIRDWLIHFIIVLVKITHLSYLFDFPILSWEGA